MNLYKLSVFRYIGSIDDIVWVSVLYCGYMLRHSVWMQRHHIRGDRICVEGRWIGTGELCRLRRTIWGCLVKHSLGNRKEGTGFSRTNEDKIPKNHFFFRADPAWYVGLTSYIALTIKNVRPYVEFVLETLFFMWIVHGEQGDWE